MHVWHRWQAIDKQTGDHVKSNFIAKLAIDNQK